MYRTDKLLDELIERYPILEPCKTDINKAYQKIAHVYENKGKLLLAGNGGSAADAEHIVGELMKGFLKPRQIDDSFKTIIMDIYPENGKSLCDRLQKALPAIALTGHAALSTAYLNDVDGKFGFGQQVFGYGRKEDAFLGLTTSGNAENVIWAAVVAKALGMKIIALTGQDGGKIKNLADVAIMVPETETYKIQELHLPVYHTLCLMLEEHFFG